MGSQIRRAGRTAGKVKELVEVITKLLQAPLELSKNGSLSYEESCRLFGAAMREVRGLLFLDQTEFGRLVGWTYSMVSRLENGRSMPPMETMLRLEQVLFIPTPVLLLFFSAASGKDFQALDRFRRTEAVKIVAQAIIKRRSTPLT